MIVNPHETAKEKHQPPWTKPNHVHCFDPRHGEPCLQPCLACEEECDPQYLAECPQDCEE